MLTTLIAIIIALALVESDAENPAQHLGSHFDPTIMVCSRRCFGMNLYRHHWPSSSSAPCWGGGAAPQLDVSTLCLDALLAVAPQMIILICRHRCLPSDGARAAISRWAPSIGWSRTHRASRAKYRGGRRMMFSIASGRNKKLTKTSSNSKFLG